MVLLQVLDQVNNCNSLQAFQVQLFWLNHM